MAPTGKLATLILRSTY